MRTLVEQAAAVATGETTSVDLVEAALQAIEESQSTLNAFTHVLSDQALERARELDATAPTGPIHGVPIAIKDLYDIAGLATSGGCAAYLDRIADGDCPVVEKLRAAGAVIVGKTNMHELAFGATTQVTCFGPTRNPWDTSRIPGGSSGGSGAAVAAGLVTMAMGSDTGGSIRMPSALCGVTGLKPTHGAVSLRGALPMTASFDTSGPLAVSADDCLLVHRTIAGRDPDYVYTAAGAPVTSRAPEDVRIALLTSWLEEAHAEVRAAVERTAKELESIGFRVSEIAGPDASNARANAFTVIVGEFAHHYRDLWDDPRVSETIHSYMELGRATTAADYTKGREASLALRLAFDRAFERVDVALTPCVPDPAPTIAETESFTAAARLTTYTFPVNAAGLPALAFPVGFSTEGLPIGAQLIGPAWSEELLCSVGSAYQNATDWHLRRPGLAA